MINLSDVSAMRIPYAAAERLRLMSDSYALSFAGTLALFTADNRFRAPLMAAKSSYEETSAYIFDYSKKVAAIGEKNLSPYTTLFYTLLAETKRFPIDGDFTEYMYGDNFGSETFSGQASHNGIDIISRENAAGKLPVVSSCAGIVEACGISPTDGYYLGVRALSGNYYYYAHLDNLSPAVFEGNTIAIGECLGFMGSSGTGESKYGYPVRLHFSILARTSLSKDELWINPYIFLRLAEGESLFYY